VLCEMHNLSNCTWLPQGPAAIFLFPLSLYTHVYTHTQKTPQAPCSTYSQDFLCGYLCFTPLAQALQDNRVCTLGVEADGALWVSYCGEANQHPSTCPPHLLPCWVGRGLELTQHRHPLARAVEVHHGQDLVDSSPSSTTVMVSWVRNLNT
jgi:hypothetical protein